MSVLIVGLVLFLGVHSVRIAADSWRSRMLERLGEGPWKGIYALLSLVGLVLIVWGYGLARLDPIVIWSPPIWTRHLAILLNLFAFLLLAIYLVPSGRLKARLHHPMVLGVKVWAFAHLLANGTLADLLLFGSFLLWAIADFASARRRDRAAGRIYVAGPVRNDVVAVAVGLVLWLAILTFLHQWLIGVSPLA
ncbi:NnrU family protein [Propylenella binzhouense]|uniref:Protein NrnU n=1 Tax=Propylenella binzhouense TaxID=2555902 RepID=A0A964WU65_9HYPH|nr:NnrU family protein [Propylenella binzhouense]MYZ48726.1 protein NrnU [Propylenella binzhouense]